MTCTLARHRVEGNQDALTSLWGGCPVVYLYIVLYSFYIGYYIKYLHNKVKGNVDQ